MNKDVIIALDFKNQNETFHFLNQFNEQLYVKIGMELFYKEGPSIISKIKERGHKIFLDLKLHDIPTTVYKSMKNIASLGIDMVNLHTLGGKEMMKAGVSGLAEGAAHQKPICIGVTLLTSTSETMLKDELCVGEHLNEMVLKLAKNAKEALLDGVVCSSLESSMIHSHLGNEFLTITPGIRLNQANKHDQQRVTTPRLAHLLGSDYIVVGRAITESIEPYKTYQLIKKEFLNEGE